MDPESTPSVEEEARMIFEAARLGHPLEPLTQNDHESESSRAPGHAQRPVRDEARAEELQESAASTDPHSNQGPAPAALPRDNSLAVSRTGTAEDKLQGPTVSIAPHLDQQLPSDASLKASPRELLRLLEDRARVAREQGYLE